MSSVDEIARQLGEVQRELDALRTESAANVGLLATAIRQTRSALAAVDQASAVRRIAGPVSLINWNPRAGEFGKTDLSSSLIDRLRSAPAGGGTAASQQTTLLLRDALAAFDAVLLTAIQPAQLEFGPGSATYDLRLQRVGAKALQFDDAAGGPAKLWLAGDQVQILGASFAVAYNGDGTVASVTRSGAQGAATTTITYAGSEVASVVTVRGGKTVTVTPAYTAGKVVSLVRAVA